MNTYAMYKENADSFNGEWDKKIKAIKLRNYKITGKQRKEKIKAINAKYENADMLFTKTERICMHNFVLNNNTLIIGGSGSGKTRGYAMPNILQAHSSYIVTDPKGEILAKSGAFLTAKGYRIRVLNLDNKTLSDSYNPFVYLTNHKEGLEERVLTLIETIIINTDGGEKQSSSDPFWEKAEKLFLQAIFFYVVYELKPDSQNMESVMTLIQMLEIAEEQDTYESPLDFAFEDFKEKHGEDNIAYQQFKEFRTKSAGETAKSIVISAVARLAPFRLSEVRRIFRNDNMCLDLAGEEKVAIFVVVPPTDKTLNFISGMLFTQLFQELQYCATQTHKHEGQRLPVPVRFILDEFANTCVIPNFVQILAYARSFGIGITVILQSLEQIKKIYEKEWGVVIDNCSTLLYLGSVSHMDTLEYMSKLLGKGTFDKKTSGRTFGKSGGSSQNFDKIGRELLDAAEIRKLPKEKCLFIVVGKDPFYSDKYDYTTHFNYRYTSDGGGESYEHKPIAYVKIKSLSQKRQENVMTSEEAQKYFDEHAGVLVPSEASEDGTVKRAAFIQTPKSLVYDEDFADETVIDDTPETAVSDSGAVNMNAVNNDFDDIWGDYKGETADENSPHGEDEKATTSFDILAELEALLQETLKSKDFTDNQPNEILLAAREMELIIKADENPDSVNYTGVYANNDGDGSGLIFDDVETDSDAEYADEIIDAIINSEPFNRNDLASLVNDFLTDLTDLSG